VSEVEDPVTTVVRLLSTNMRVVKDDLSIASILVTSEWCNREVFKNYDGQITVGLRASQDLKVELSGRIRRRVGTLAVNVWGTDRSDPKAEPGKVVRRKMLEEVLRIVRQNRAVPNRTVYTFYGLGTGSSTNRTYDVGNASELGPSDAGWTELSAAEYAKIWSSDDQRHSKSHGVNNQFALMLFRFKLESRELTAKRIILFLEGYGTAPGGNGATVKVWNHTTSAWGNAASGTESSDETITITLTSSLSDYIDGSGFVWLLAKTTNPSNGSTPAILYCDYASCTVTVNGITYCDVATYRDQDNTEVSPFVFRTEIGLKSWLFEDVGGAY
jgi:hypothetical protein